MSASRGDIVTVAVERFNHDTEQWEHFHNAGLNEIIREIHPDFRGKLLLPQANNTSKPRMVRLMEQCRQLGYSGLKEAFAEWQTTQYDLTDPVVACHVCKAYHDASHSAGGRSAGAGSPRKSGPSGWSPVEDAVLLTGIRQGRNAPKIISHLPIGTTRTAAAVRGRKRVLVSRDRAASRLAGLGGASAHLQRKEHAGPTSQASNTGSASRSQPISVPTRAFHGDGNDARTISRNKGKGRVTQAMEDGKERQGHGEVYQEDSGDNDSESLAVFIAHDATRHLTRTGVNIPPEHLTGRAKGGISPLSQTIRSSPSCQKGRRRTKEDDNIVLEALHHDWDATMIPSRLPDSAQRTPSGIRSRGIALRKKHAQHPASPRQLDSASREGPGGGGQARANSPPPTRPGRRVHVVDLCDLENDLDEDLDEESPMTVRTPHFKGREGRKEHPSMEREGADLAAKVAAGRPIVYVVLNGLRKFPHRVEKRRQPAIKHTTQPPQACGHRLRMGRMTPRSQLQDNDTSTETS